MSKFYWGVIVTLLIVWLFREGCNCHSLKQKDAQITELNSRLNQQPTIKHDTIRSKGDTVLVPHPYPVPGKDIPQPISVFTTVPVNNFDSAYVAYLIRIKDDYFRSFYYTDSLSTPFGKVYSRDSVHQNRLTWSAPYWDFSNVQTTYYIHDTITKEAPVRGRVFIGPEFLGKRDTIRAFGLAVDWATNRNLQVGAGGYYDRKTKDFLWKGSVKFDLFSRRRR